MSIHRQRWENRGFCYTVHFSPQKRDSENCCALLQNRKAAFLSFMGIFVLLPYLTCKPCVKLLVKYIFYQFLAISNAKMHEELVHPSIANIRQVQIRYISILLTAKGFDLVLKHLQGWMVPQQTW